MRKIIGYVTAGVILATVSAAVILKQKKIAPKKKKL
jgi:hypothetical protein